jgi:addiction module HigA family antidote
MLAEEFLGPLGMTQVELAERLEIPFQRVNQIIRGKRAVTPDTALRLSQLFGTSAEFWLNLQQAWDLSVALRSPAAGQIRRIRPLSQAKRRPAAS